MPSDSLSRVRRMLDRRRDLEDNIVRALYVGPRPGHGRHLVETAHGQVEVAGTQTYKPGTPVMLAKPSQPGQPAVIVHGPPGGRGSVADYQRVIEQPGAPLPEPSACPDDGTGHSYLGVYVDHGAKVVYAYLYADGAYQSTLGSLAYTGLWHSIPEDAVFWRVAGDRLLFTARAASAAVVDRIITWDPAAGTHWTAETDTPTHAYTFNPVPISDTEALAASGTDSGDYGLEWFRFSLATNISAATFAGLFEAGVAYDVFEGFHGPLLVTAASPLALFGGFHWEGVDPARSEWFGLGQSDVPDVPEEFLPTTGSPGAGTNPVGGRLVSGGALIGSDADGDGAAMVGLGVLSGAGVYTRWTPDAWSATLGSIAAVAPSPSGAEYVALLGSGSIVRLPVGPIGEECTLYLTAVDAGPEGAPVAMLPRD